MLKTELSASGPLAQTQKNMDTVRARPETVKSQTKNTCLYVFENKKEMSIAGDSFD